MRRKDRKIEDREILRRIIEGAEVCRLAFAVGDLPYLVALNFGYEWDGELPILYFHCAREGRKLEMMRQNPHVCFALDIGHKLVAGSAPCDWGMNFESLVGYGTLSEISGEAERRGALDRIMRHYGWGGEGSYRGSTLGSTLVLKLVVDEVSGKKKG